MRIYNDVQVYLDSTGSEGLSDLQTEIKRNQTCEDLEGDNSRQRKNVQIPSPGENSSLV